MITISEKWSVSKKRDSKSYKGQDYFTYSLGGWSHYCISPDMGAEAERIAQVLTACDLKHPAIVAVREFFFALASVETDLMVNMNLSVHDKRILKAWKRVLKQAEGFPLLKGGSHA